MKNSVVITLGALLLFVLGMQAFMFYRFHEQLEQRFALEENLNQSSHEGSNTWIQASNNWNPYDELFQMRNQVQQLFNDSISRFNKNSTAHSFTQMPAIDLKDEQDRYVVTADVPGANESSLNVALKDRQLSISIKTESVNEKTDDNNKYERRERFSGEFQRSITLPGDVNQDGMKTEYNKGVLTIILPKV
jgi:HSP20 family protein